jgi:2-oxo-4-hydroxy-4-carboxy-5-ureidoimidazoline decarboxylase
MSGVLERWNNLDEAAAAREILPCCGSRRWAEAVSGQRPFQTEPLLLSASDEIWNSLDESDWQQAFDAHPRIGETKAPVASTHRSAQWSKEEQQSVGATNDDVKVALAAGNREYESRFGRIFIVCATGKSASEMLSILRHRLGNDPATELREAAEQQRQITQLRLRKWLNP